MVFRRRTQALICVLAVLLPGLAHAQQANDCPKQLGSVSNDRLATAVTKVMIDIYEKLGCPIRVETMPGRRGFIAFNEGQVDGEMFRFPVAAQYYSRAFVQSEVPLLEISNSLWAAPGSKLHSDGPTGYVIGLAWQEQYLANTPDETKSGHRDVDDVISHYNMGTFDRFLAEDETIRLAIANGAFAKGQEPVQLEAVKVGALYHFLGAEFAPFMNRLSQYLTDHPPFERSGAM